MAVEQGALDFGIKQAAPCGIDMGKENAIVGEFRNYLRFIRARGE